MKNIEFEGLTCFTVNLEIGHSPMSDKFGILIIESNPQPDYYALQNFPPNTNHVNDRHIYLLANNQTNCFQDIVLTVSYNLKSRLHKDLRIFPGQMTFHNKDFQAVRINTTTTKDLPVIIRELQNNGVELMKDKKVATYSSRLYFKKFIEFIELESGVYQDIDNLNRYFFKISHKPNFDEFTIKMEKIKNNCQFHLFDPFFASLFIKMESVYFIGIYSEHCDQARFGDLKQQIAELFY